jgi:hypothetical protein
MSLILKFSKLKKLYKTGNVFIERKNIQYLNFTQTLIIIKKKLACQP